MNQRGFSMATRCKTPTPLRVPCLQNGPPPAWCATDVDVDLTQIFWEGIHGFTARHLVMGLDDRMPEVPNEAHRDLMIEVLLTWLAAAFAPR